MALAVSLINMKGGVGKSTLAVNLVYEYATAPWYKKTLLVDLDPQFNASQYLLGQDRYEKLIVSDNNPTTWDIFEQNTRAPGRAATNLSTQDAIIRVRQFGNGSIDLIPSRLELSLSLRNPAQKESLLAKSLGAVADQYDIIVIDCSPTESILNLAAYLASDYILVPVKPEYLSSIGLPLLNQSVSDFRRENPDSKLEIAGVVFNATSDYTPEEDKAKAETRKLADGFGWKTFQAEVPYSRSFPKGAREGQPIFWTSYVRSSQAGKFRAFAEEFANKIGITA